jgi:GMP synthase-like glutamine amidotransferase
VRLLSIQHPNANYAGLFADAAAAEGITYDQWCPGEGEAAPGDLGDYDALIVLGGEQNVEDEPVLPYLTEEIDLIGDALDRGMPILGVCLGAQLLASAAGAETVRVSDPEIGWYDVETLPAAEDDPVFSLLPERFSAYCWHSFAVELPEEATPLARSAVCTHAFRLGERSWGVQFHPEVTREILLEWFAGYRSDPDAVALGFDPEAAEAELEGRLAPWAVFGRALFGAFVAAARPRPPRARPAPG